MVRYRLLESIYRRLWVIPLLGVVTGGGLSLLTASIDRARPHALLPSSVVGKAGDAQTILSTIASSVVTLTSIVLTVTLVAIQLAMGQFSPRIVRALLDDRADQLVIATFAATFTFALFSLRTIDSGPGAPVPGLTLLTAYALTLASAAALFLFVHRAGHRLRVAGLVDVVGHELRKELDKRYPALAVPEDLQSPVVVSPEAGNVVHIDHAGLVKEAENAGCLLELVPMMGDFVTRGSPLVRVHGDPSGVDRAALRRLIVLGDERTHADDPAYGFRKLVDVAQRALGASQNDPATADQVINRLHDCLRQIAARPFPSGRHLGSDGQLRVVSRMIGWDGLVRLAFDEVRLAAAHYPAATRRLIAALEDLKDVAPGDRQAALDRQLRLLRIAVERSYQTEEDAQAAMVPDLQGIGSGPDVSSPPLSGATSGRSSLA
jgi:uncharacterized membrane protein